MSLSDDKDINPPSQGSQPPKYTYRSKKRKDPNDNIQEHDAPAHTKPNEGPASKRQRGTMGSRSHEHGRPPQQDSESPHSATAPGPIMSNPWAVMDSRAMLASLEEQR